MKEINLRQWAFLTIRIRSLLNCEKVCDVLLMLIDIVSYKTTLSFKGVFFSFFIITLLMSL